jgi:hypothetical protein
MHAPIYSCPHHHLTLTFQVILGAADFLVIELTFHEHIRSDERVLTRQSAQGSWSFEYLSISVVVISIAGLRRKDMYSR